MRKLVAGGLGAVLVLGLTVTSFAAEAGTPVNVTGTPEDSFCWSTMDAHGAGHKKCATKCVKAGSPVSLVEKGSGKIYILLPPKDVHPIPDAVINHMEDEVTVSGKVYTKGGVNYLTVESVK